jgi:tRNA nucleotidyltransferase/poly(A) polymerase
MKLRELLDLLKNVGDANGISDIKIVGGTPRDKVLHLIKPGEMNDLDLTTGNKNIHNLAVEVGIELKKRFNINTKKGDDGHTSIHFPGDGFKLDFSSFFVVPEIEKLLLKKGISNPTDLQKESFSRDFTCNTLLLDLDLKKISDPTNLGLADIQKKILNTCLDPDITFKSNTNRIIRVVYMAAKLDFDVNSEILKWILKNKDIIRLTTDHYLKTTIDKALSKNPERAVSIINKTDLWGAIPITDMLKPYYDKKSAIVPIKSAQIRQNYDLNENIYSNLDKYKSVSDFRKKRMKKRKKILKDIKEMKLK